MAKVESSPSSEIADSHRLISTGDIELETVSDIEDNLTDCEKVSLVFLLYDDVNIAIEQLEMLVDGCKEDSPRINLLEDWAKGGEQYWKETLLEGLAIIKAYREIKDLNFDLQQVKDHFSPNQLNKSIFIHPVKKALFGMCEEFLIKDTENFINNVLDISKIAIKEHKNHLELFLLHMMKDEIITVGTWSPPEMKRTQTQEKSNLDIICNFLKTNNFFQLHDALNSVIDFLNDRQLALIKIDGKNAPESTNSINEKGISTEEDGVYPIIDKNSLGWFLIFNHKTFINNAFKVRSGTEKDVEELKNCWSSYGFTPIVFDDLKAEDILKEIKEYAESVKESHSAFGVCILSHGDNRGVFGSDGQHLEIGLIKNVLETKNLIDRPKILLVQACRGHDKMQWYELEESRNIDNSDVPLEADGPPNTPVQEKADLIVFFATVEEFVSYRHRVDGSLFINALCKCLLQYGNNYHLSDVFTKVTEEIANKGRQISQHTSTFRKCLYLKGSQCK